MVRRFPALVGYAERIHDRYFPDYKRWLGMGKKEK